MPTAATSPVTTRCRTFLFASIDRTSVADLAELIKGHQFDRIRFQSFRLRHGRCGQYDFSLNALLQASRRMAAN